MTFPLQLGVYLKEPALNSTGDSTLSQPNVTITCPGTETSAWLPWLGAHLELSPDAENRPYA